LCRPNATRNRSKSRGSVTCNYCKKPGHIKTECRALKAKNEKFTQKGSRMEEVNFCGLSSTTLRSTVGDTLEDDPNILNVESTTEAEVLLTTEDATSWLLDSGASYHVSPFRMQFRSYTARSFDPVRVENLQHCSHRHRHRRAQPSGWLYDRTSRCSACPGGHKVAHFGGTTRRRWFLNQLLVSMVEYPQRESPACSWSEDILLVSFVCHAQRR
jgi:hypothetical protein